MPFLAFLISLLLFCGLVSWSLARGLLARDEWRRCNYCARWFNEHGEISQQLPSHAARFAPPGVCHDCAAEAEFRHQ